MFSILIPSFNNCKIFRTCINSIKKNSKYDHQIIVHVNIGDDGTLEYLNKNNIEYTHTKYNSGICEGINKAAKLANMIIYFMLMMIFILAPTGTKYFMKK